MIAGAGVPRGRYDPGEEPTMAGIIAACAAFSVLTAARAQEATEPTIEQELAALIEKTNALKAFHVVYDMESTSEGLPKQTSLEITYVGPATGHLIASGPDADTEWWFVEQRMYARVEGSWRRAEAREAGGSVPLLDEIFPSDEFALDPGLILQLHVERQKVSLSLASSLWNRSVVLAWLQDMQGIFLPSQPRASFLVWTGEGSGLLVSRSTGFIEQLDVTGPNGDRHMRLRSLQTDDIDPSRATPPEEAREATIDPDLLRQLSVSYSPEAMRSGGFHRVQRLLDSGHREWDERCRSDWRSFLEAVHEEALHQRYEKWLDEIRAWIERGSASMRAQLDADDSPETRARLREQMESARASMVSKLDTTESKCLESLSPPGDGEWHDGLLEIEIEVVRKAYDEVIRQPTFTFLRRADHGAARGVGGVFDPARISAQLAVETRPPS
jgi:hypothetical protein